MIHFFTSPYFLLLCFMVGQRFCYFSLSMSVFVFPWSGRNKTTVHAKCTHVKLQASLTIAVFSFSFSDGCRASC
ncbi:hypothetical protein F5H01DRAFT_332851 [Linnemannia elongata]|nr:hypothetical protein F5H01DRAFT_332851 [Linnemannia elongata]